MSFCLKTNHFRKNARAFIISLTLDHLFFLIAFPFIGDKNTLICRRSRRLEELYKKTDGKQSLFCPPQYK